MPPHTLARAPRAWPHPQDGVRRSCTVGRSAGFGHSLQRKSPLERTTGWSLKPPRLSFLDGQGGTRRCGPAGALGLKEATCVKVLGVVPEPAAPASVTWALGKRDKPRPHPGPAESGTRGPALCARSARGPEAVPLGDADVRGARAWTRSVHLTGRTVSSRSTVSCLSSVNITLMGIVTVLTPQQPPESRVGTGPRSRGTPAPMGCGDGQLTTCGRLDRVCLAKAAMGVRLSTSRLKSVPFQPGHIFPK